MFRIALTAAAVGDIAWLRKLERKAVLDGIQAQLAHEPGVETRNRKRLRPNQVAEWELRIGEHRVFYDVAADANTVSVVMVGRKDGSTLLVRGREYVL